MEEYIAGNYQESILIFERDIQEKREELSIQELGMLYCNIGACEFGNLSLFCLSIHFDHSKGLNLYRKCIQSCDQSISIDNKCLRAYLIQAASYIAMKKYENAKETCESALQHTSNYSDTQMVKQVKEYLTMINSMINVNVSTSTSILTAAQAAASSTPSSSSSSSSLVSSSKNKNKDDKKSKNSFVITLEHLTTLRDQFISEGDEPGKVQRAYLAGARENLSYATGEDVVDDLIGFGYLLVNSSRLNEAEELFNVLLQYK